MPKFKGQLGRPKNDLSKRRRHRVLHQAQFTLIPSSLVELLAYGQVLGVGLDTANTSLNPIENKMLLVAYVFGLVNSPLNDLFMFVK